MSARKSRERAQKKNERLQQGKVLAGIKPPESVPTPSTVLVPAPPNLSPQDAMLLEEIKFITAQLRTLLQQTSAKILARALVEGMREAGKESQ